MTVTGAADALRKTSVTGAADALRKTSVAGAETLLLDFSGTRDLGCIAS